MKDDQSSMVLMPRSIVMSLRILIKVLSSRFLILNLTMEWLGGRGERTGLERSPVLPWYILQMGIPDSRILPCLIKRQIFVHYLCIFNANSNSLTLLFKICFKNKVCGMYEVWNSLMWGYKYNSLISATVEQLPRETVIKMASFKKLFGEEHVRL